MIYSIDPKGRYNVTRVDCSPKMVTALIVAEISGSLSALEVIPSV